MTDSDAYNGKCPDCGRVFTLADLKHMAVGDGWRRFVFIKTLSGPRAIDFNKFRPATMEAVNQTLPQNATHKRAPKRTPELPLDGNPADANL